MKKLLDEKGQIEILFLFVVVILFLAAGWSVRLVQNVTLGDLNLKGAVALAVKGAAGQFEEEGSISALDQTQDETGKKAKDKKKPHAKDAVVLVEENTAGKPKKEKLDAFADQNVSDQVLLSDQSTSIQQTISPEQALETFKYLLAVNLGLNSEDLTPLENTVWIKKPNYTLIVYNGTSGVKYIYEDGQLTQVDIPATGFPAQIELQGLEISLTSPGVIASVEMTAKGIFGKELTFERWAGARVAGDGEVAVLGKNG